MINHEQKSNRVPREEIGFQREGNVAHLYKPEANYTIIYQNHDTKINPDKLPEPLDGLFLEDVSDYLKHPLSHVEAVADNVYFKDLLKSLEKRRIPLFFPDLIPIIQDERITPFLAASEVVFPSSLEGIATVFILSRYFPKKTISRRSLLKFAAGGTLSVWLSTPLISIFSRGVLEDKLISEDAAAEFFKFSNKIHPEVGFLSMHIRNAVIAHKEEWLAKQLANKPHFANIMGPFHLGIEDMLQLPPKDRLEFIKVFSHLWKSIFVPESLYKILRVNFEGNAWQVGDIFEVPELKELVAS